MKIQLFIILISILIFVYDMKFRAIPVWLFMILAPLLLVLNFIARPLEEYLTSSSINLLILIIQIGGLRIYTYMRSGRNIKFLNGCIGAADILMLAILCFSFSPLQYTVFITLGCFSGIVFHLVFRGAKKIELTIPLAGILSLGYGVLLLFNLLFTMPMIFPPKSL